MHEIDQHKNRFLWLTVQEDLWIKINKKEKIFKSYRDNEAAAEKSISHSRVSFWQQFVELVSIAFEISPVREKKTRAADVAVRAPFLVVRPKPYPGLIDY